MRRVDPLLITFVLQITLEDPTMICQIDRIINSVGQEFWKIPLKELYGRILGIVRMRRSGFYIPSCERYVEADEYILWGTYTRERIIDIQ